MGSPTQRSKKLLEKEGYLVGITEKWNAHARIRQDLFGFIDMIAVKENEVLGVQTTSYSNLSARVTKILLSECYPIVKASGIRIVAHGWKKNKSKRWEVKIKEL
jgi:hypothetical protein